MTTTNNPATTQTAADSDVATVTTTTIAFVDDDVGVTRATIAFVDDDVSVTTTAAAYVDDDVSSDCVFLNAAVSARLAAVSVESDEFKKTRSRASSKSPRPRTERPTAANSSLVLISIGNGMLHCNHYMSTCVPSRAHN